MRIKDTKPKNEKLVKRGRGQGHVTYFSNLNGKRVVDFLLVLTELFFARCYGWGATGEYRLKIGDFARTGAGWPKCQVEGVAPHQPFFFSKK